MNDEINLSKDFRQHGFVIQKNIVPPSWFDNVRTNMLSIMQPYCDNQNNDSCDASLVDELFLKSQPRVKLRRPMCIAFLVN